MITPNAAILALRAREAAGEKIPKVPLVYFGLPVPQRWAICGVPLVWGGFTWQPLDIALSAVQDQLGQVNSATFTLPAATPADLALAAQDVEGTPATISLAWVDPLNAQVAGVRQLWAGELDQPGWQDGPQAAAQFSAAHRSVLAMLQRVTRYTNDEQRRLYAGDTALDVDPATDAPPLVWPAASYFRV